MRAIIFLAVLAAAVAGGYYFYTQQSTQAPQQSPELFAPPPAAPPPPRAAECQVTRATYRLRGDPRIRLTFEAPPGFSADAPAPANPLVDSGSAGPPAIVVFHITTTAQTYKFEPVVTQGYERMLLYPFANGRSTALTGANAITIAMFDDEYDYIDGVPEIRSAAPAHLFAPDLTRWVYNQGGARRVNAPVGMFDFDQCARPPNAATAAEAPAPAKQ